MDEYGEIDKRLLPTARFANMFYLLPDRSLFILQDSLVIHYNNMFDELPADTTTVQYPSNWLKGSQSISVDSVGELRILGWKRTGVDYIHMFVALYPFRQVEQILRCDTIDLSGYSDNSTIARNVRYKETRRRLLCANSYVVEVVFEFDIYNSFDHEGWVTSISTVYITAPDGGIYAAKDVNLLSCSLPPAESVYREGLWVNRIKARIQNSDKYFILDTLISYKADAIQNMPAIAVRNNTIVVTYMQYTTPDMYLPVYRYLGKWNSYQDTVSSFKSHTSLSGIYNSWPIAHWITNANMFFLACRNDYTYRYRGRNEFLSTFATRYVPTDTGWCQARNWTTMGHFSSRSMLASGYNPVRDELIIIDDYQETPRRSYATINSRGDSIAGITFRDTAILNWSFHGDLVPIDSSSFLLFNFNTTLLYKDKVVSIIPDYVVPKTGARIQRLMDDSFLEVYSEDTRSIRLRVVSLSGKLRYEKSLDFSEPSPFVVGQSPMNGEIFLLRSGKGGVKLTMMNNRLETLTGADSASPIMNIPISETRDSVGVVSGVFRNDTLFVVWEDFRTGNDIYGTIWKRPNDLIAPGFLPTTPDPINSELAILEMGPTPVHDFLTLQVQAPQQGKAMLHVIDMLGRIVLQQEWSMKQSVQNFFLNTQELFPGVYTALVESGGQFRSRRFLVIR